jgi:hypothetical protein
MGITFYLGQDAYTYSARARVGGKMWTWFYFETVMFDPSQHLNHRFGVGGPMIRTGTYCICLFKHSFAVCLSLGITTKKVLLKVTSVK